MTFSILETNDFAKSRLGMVNYEAHLAKSQQLDFLIKHIAEETNTLKRMHKAALKK